MNVLYTSVRLPGVEYSASHKVELLQERRRIECEACKRKVCLFAWENNYGGGFPAGCRHSTYNNSVDCRAGQSCSTSYSIMSSLAALEARTKAAEHFHIAQEEQSALLRIAQRLVEQGKLPASMLDKLHNTTTPSGLHSVPAAFADVPTTVNTKPPGYIYQHVQRGPSLPPPPKGAEAYMGMGSSVSFGRGRWNAHGASIFSVQDGKRLAQTPVKETMVPWEQARHAKIIAAARQTPLLWGYRYFVVLMVFLHIICKTSFAHTHILCTLSHPSNHHPTNTHRVLPEMTPGRALLWGSLLALWGTALTVKVAAAQLGITSAQDAPAVLREVVQPYAQALSARMQPLKSVVCCCCFCFLCGFLYSHYPVQHPITCTPSHAHRHMHTITCTPSHAHHHMHTITCTHSCHQWLLAQLTRRQCPPAALLGALDGNWGRRRRRMGDDEYYQLEEDG